jgi:hypothetical protein
MTDNSKRAIEITALDVLESLIGATYIRDRTRFRQNSKKVRCFLQPQSVRDPRLTRPRHAATVGAKDPQIEGRLSLPFPHSSSEQALLKLTATETTHNG